MSLPNDIYGRTVVKNTVGDKNIYTIASSIIISVDKDTSDTIVYSRINSMPPSNYGTNVTLALQTKLLQFEKALDDFITSSFSITTRLNLLALFIDAKTSELINRAAYIYQVLSWMLSLKMYSNQYTALLCTMTNPEEIMNTPWNFSSLNPPIVTITGALAILD